MSKDEFSAFKSPPIFEDLNDRLKDYLLKPENLSIHKWERSQTHWHREVNVNCLLEDGEDEIGPDSTLEVVRDPITGGIVGIEEVPIPVEDDDESLSMSRAPLPPNMATRGTTTQMPFLPGGFEEELQKILDEAAQNEEIKVDLGDDEIGKFLGEEILTIPPGCKEGVLFSADGVTVLNDLSQEDIQTVENREEDIDIQIKINLEEIVSTNAHLVGLWKDEEEPKLKPKATQKTDAISEDNDDNFLESTIIRPPVELPDIPILNIAGSAVRPGVTTTEWAEMIDVSLPVPDFREKIKDMAQSYPFELDNFQKQAILKLEEGHHVFVAAHTSAGKTVVAEYAIAMSRRNCTRSIYTSPIKALSNQKYNDFLKMFGEVGLLTGDLQINATAPCLVMTTEILRSMLYCGSDVTRDLEFVIFDEVHYINNAERGHVWEEVLILLPSHVSIVMLSATVPNTLQFADWVGRTKKRKVYVVSTPKRPVPLCHYLYTGSGGKSKNERFQVIDQDGNFLLRGYNEAVAAKKARENTFDKNFGPKGGKFMKPKAEQTMWVAFIDHLRKCEKLPVVAFTLSRNRCDQNAENLLSVDLTTAKEKSHIHSFFQKCLQRLKEPDRKLPQVIRLQRVLMSGIGVHHSGILPLLKEIVEMLFQSGHVKILFATETFAMGVNMPARTVVFDEVTKFDGIERRVLAPAEYIQMAGRAGRRGLDDTGTVIILCKDIKVPDLVDLKGMMMGIPQKLSSQFRLTYAMILSLLRVATVSVEGMMQRSFREFDHIIQADNYRKQLRLAEKEFTEKCSASLASHLAPLANFYDTAAAYLDVLNEIMPLLLDQPKVSKELVPGKILIVSVGPYINQLAVYLNNSGPRTTPYKLLLLDTAKLDKDTTKYNFDVDESWYRMIGLSHSHAGYGTEESTLEHTVLCAAAKSVVAVSKVTLKIDERIVIQDWEQRQMPRFKDAPVGAKCLAAVQELSRLSHAVKTGATTLETISLTQSLAIRSGEILHTLDKMNSLQAELEVQKKSTDIANFRTEFALVYERKQAERKRDKYRRLLSFENLALYPDYQRRLMVLRELNYIDDHDSVILKGRVACGMGTNELIISELVFRNVFTDKTPAEIAALLSCFVFQARTQIAPTLSDRLKEGVLAIEKIDEELSSVESKFLVGQFEGQTERLNFGLVRVVYEWALEKPFAEIMDLTDVQEGIIVRCIQQLHEVLIDVKDAAVAIGDPKLQAKMMEASTAIKRDIVFAASLYTTQRETVIS